MSKPDLSGRRVLALVSNYGVEQDELVVPVDHLREHGAEVDVAAVEDDPIETLVGDKDPGKAVTPTTTISQVDPSAYHLLLLPGGTINADQLRLDEDAVGVVTAFESNGRPIAAICHGPWALVEAGVVDGRRLTSYASLQTDIRNAGGQWVDDAAVVDDSRTPTLITSRTPKDLEDFLREIDRALSGSR
ncbi:type 1 glutamine amidotransferase [Mumia sp. zg.B17]|uniref:DJ-1/PfpI/YhbO family deglycase/protease n=1 Tax=Mumia sp. zg.B17 TaxID=2855446 RepID=UPI001C6E0DBF|nr:type 1 glutamine amidotransferase domain-containing protein [Mumia sp. zg.B17]MBW9207857.1 type 1 glutamine amidotransferase [Mumia sp. zg.B17]